MYALHATSWLAIAWLAEVVHGQFSLFDFEKVQLTDAAVGNYSDIAFASDANAPPPQSECRAFPGSKDWPTEDEWSFFNTTLGGAVLKPVPLGIYCYPGPYYYPDGCNYLVNTAPSTHLYVDDPIQGLTKWVEGDTCTATLNPAGNCTQGGFPVYVVNAANVAQIQAAVNFARNRNLRLVIKNTGHDFGGRSVGAGSLSVWVHNLKTFSFIREVTFGEYTGMAVQLGAGIESYELYDYMAAYGITVVAPGDSTVGPVGGWSAAGGHGWLTSFYGLGSDQILSMQVVTANGTFVTASPYSNPDLFYALRGGAGSTYGIVTSVVMKAYPPIQLAGSSLSLTTFGNTNATNTTYHFPRRQAAGADPNALAPDLFWEATRLYIKFGSKIVDAGGIGYTFIYALGNNSFTFTALTQFPSATTTQAYYFMAELYNELAALGINITNPTSVFSSTYGSQRPAGGVPLVNTRYRSRLFPRANWADDALFNKTWAAIRASGEDGGYTFHGILHGPSEKIAGWPGTQSGVNPAWRNAYMHASIYGEQPSGLSAQAAVADQDRVQGYMKLWRDATQGSGAYINEGDPGEPEWQQSFFGDKYATLLKVKQKWDPWNVFWAQTTVGSEGWEVKPFDGYPDTQNGMLCRVG